MSIDNNMSSNGEKRQTYKNCITILWNDLYKAIDHYIKGNHNAQDIKYITAYLGGCLFWIIAFYDIVLKVIAPQRYPETDEIKACKYASNLVKHNEVIISHTYSDGGISFPIGFPVEINNIDILWKNGCLDVIHSDQKVAYNNKFADKSVKDTLQPIIDLMLKA